MTKLFTFTLLLLCYLSCAEVRAKEIRVTQEQFSKLKKEKDYNNLLAQVYKRDYEYVYTEVRYPYDKGYVYADLELFASVYECGLDKRTSLDSIQQAAFFSVVSGKYPVVVIYDTDGKEGKYEYRIRKACRYVGIDYINIRFVSE